MAAKPKNPHRAALTAEYRSMDLIGLIEDDTDDSGQHDVTAAQLSEFCPNSRPTEADLTVRQPTPAEARTKKKAQFLGPFQNLLVGARGFEPPTPRSRTECSRECLLGISPICRHLGNWGGN